MFSSALLQHPQHILSFVCACLISAASLAPPQAAACDKQKAKAETSGSTFLRYVGDHDPGHEIEQRAARLEHRLNELQGELDQLRAVLAELGGRRDVRVFAPPPAPVAPQFGAFPAPPPTPPTAPMPPVPPMPVMPPMPEIDLSDIPEHMENWREHVREWQGEWREQQAEMGEQWRERVHNWQERRHDLAEQWREWQHDWKERQQEWQHDWKEQQREWKHDWQDRQRELRDRLEELKIIKSREVREKVERRQRLTERRARGERRERQRTRERERPAKSGRVVYNVTGPHADMLYDLLAPSDVRLIVSRAGERIAVQGTEQEHEVLSAALQLLSWTDRDGVFERMGRGQRIDRTYRLGAERANRLFDMLAPGDVRMVVSRAGADAVSVAGTRREQGVLEGFLEMLNWKEIEESD